MDIFEGHCSTYHSEYCNYCLRRVQIEDIVEVLTYQEKKHLPCLIFLGWVLPVGGLTLVQLEKFSRGGTTGLRTFPGSGKCWLPLQKFRLLSQEYTPFSPPEEFCKLSLGGWTEIK